MKFLRLFFEDTLAGFISFKIDEEEVDIHRLVVSLIIFIKGLQQNYYFMYLTCSPFQNIYCTNRERKYTCFVFI